MLILFLLEILENLVLIIKVTKKKFESIFEKIKHEDKNFSSRKRDWKNVEQNNKSIAINILFSSKDSEEITLLY